MKSSNSRWSTTSSTAFANAMRRHVASDIHVTALTDLWLQFSHMPIGNLRIGNQKEAIGFEHIVSSRFLPFMERSYNQDTFYGGSFNGFSPGRVTVRTISWRIGRAGTSASTSRPTTSSRFSTNDGDYAVTGRVTYLPIYEDEGRQVVHLGRLGPAGHDVRRPHPLPHARCDSGRAFRRSGPSPADITVFGDTMQWLNAGVCRGAGTVDVAGGVALQLHAATRSGSTATAIRSARRSTRLLYQGGYVQVLYFLTGESDNYSLERMAFDRVKPYENFFWVPGDDCCNYFARGAWQVGARYNYLDLNDQGINGGQLHNFTPG